MRDSLDDEDGTPQSLRATVSAVPPAAPPASSRERRRGTTRLLLAIGLMLVCGAFARGATPFARALANHFVAGMAAVQAHVWPASDASSSARPAQRGFAPEAPPAAPRADEHLVRAGRSQVGPGLLTLPPSFESKDGAYDLVVHFHGNTDLVEDSFGVAGVNAAVLIVNLGIGSGVYEDRFASPDELHELLARAQRTLERRGLANAHLRRLGLTAWSAGYGAILRIVENPGLAQQVDAIVLLDGLHARALPEDDLHAGQIDLRRIDPFVRFARAAVAGDKLFVITHSEIKPTEYAGCRETANAMLELLHVERTTGGLSPEMPALASTHGVPKSKIIPLEPRSVAHAGGLYVRGFGGETPEHHMAHLIRMATVGLPELAKRFGQPDAPPR